MKKNILIFLNTYLPGYKSGGPVQAVANLIEALHEHYNFFVVTRDRDYKDIQAYSNIEYNIWNKVGNAQVRYLHPKERNLKTYKKIIKDTDFDLLYLQSFWNPKFSILPLIAFWLSKKNIPILIHPRGEFFKGALKQKYIKKFFVLLIWKIFKIYNKVFFNVSSKEEKQYMLDIFTNINKKNLYIAIDFPKKYQLIEYENKFSRELKLVFISRIDYKKNLLVLINNIKKLDIDVIFDIYGDISSRDYWLECQESIKNISNKHININYCGVLEHNKIQETLSKYDLFCFFTKGENFGYVIHEALSSGLPILISDKTPWHKMAEYNAGWEIPLDKPELINEKILEYYNKTDEEKLAMHKGALQYATDVSNDKQILEDNIKMFDSIMGNSK